MTKWNKEQTMDKTWNREHHRTLLKTGVNQGIPERQSCTQSGWIEGAAGMRL